MAEEWHGGVVESMADDAPPTVSDWEPVTVPGTPERFAGTAGAIAYRRQFPDPRGSDDERAVLGLHGVTGKAHVWMNEEYLGRCEDPISPATFAFEPAAVNDLVVACEPSPTTAALADRPELHPKHAVPSIRTDVTVSRSPPTFIGDVRVTPRLRTDGATLEVAVDVDTAVAIDDALTFSVRPEGFRGGASMERARVHTEEASLVTVEKTIEIRDPKRWWPRGVGDQHRYTVRAKIGQQTVERTIGFASVEWTDDGLLVNDEPVAARGFTLRPGVDPDDAVDRAVAANATILRVPAHVPPARLYERCDETGILLWQGLTTAEPVDVERTIDVGRRLFEERGHHPSLAAVSIVDATGKRVDQPLGNGRLARWRYRYRTWRTDSDRIPAESVASELPSRRPAIPTIGPPGSGAGALTIWPGWRYLSKDAVEWLVDRYPEIDSGVAAFGAGTVPASDPNDEQTTGILSMRGLDTENAHAYQATVVKSVAESLRYRGCPTIVADTLVDGDEGDSMGLVSTDGEEKPALEAVATAFEPIQVIARSTPVVGGRVDLSIVNDLDLAGQGRVRWRCGDDSGSMGAEIEPRSSIDVGEVSIPGDAADLRLTLDVDDHRVTNRYPIE